MRMASTTPGPKTYIQSRLRLRRKFGAILLPLSLGCANPRSQAPVSSQTRPSAASSDEEKEGRVFFEKVSRASRRYLDLLVELYPESASALGLHERDSDLDDRSPAGAEKAQHKVAELLRDLEAWKDVPTRGEAAIDLALLKGALRVTLRTLQDERPHERKPDYYAEPLNALYLMMAHPYAPARDRALHALARMEKIPAVLALAKKNLKNPPKVWTEVGLQAAKGAAAFLTTQEKALDEALPGQQEHVAQVTKIAAAAYADYVNFLEREVLPRSNGSYKAGRERFEFLLRERYFLRESSEDLLKLGEQVFERTNLEMDRVARRIDPQAKTWFSVLGKVKAKHPSAADLLHSYEIEVARARTFLMNKDVVSFPAGERCDVVETPPFQRSTVTAAYEQPPPFDPITPGLFYVTPVDATLSRGQQEEFLRENDHGDQVDTAVHETYPGHHLQLSLARLHRSVIRKTSDAAVFSEGWALYAEELMHELGYYTDEERLMQLEWTLVRAARVMIDIGLHVGDMSFDAAIDMLTRRVHLEKPLALSEVQRYTMTPTQPLAYLIGREKIFQLRERFRAREKEKFSLKRFHDELLSHGTIPPGLIEREMFDEGP